MAPRLPDRLLLLGWVRPLWDCSPRPLLPCGPNLTPPDAELCPGCSSLDSSGAAWVTSGWGHCRSSRGDARYVQDRTRCLRTAPKPHPCHPAVLGGACRGVLAWPALANSVGSAVGAAGGKKPHKISSILPSRDDAEGRLLPPARGQLRGPLLQPPWEIFGPAQRGLRGC